MPRPMRFAPPVTRITLPVRSDGLLSMDLHFVRLDAFAPGLRQPAREMRPRPDEHQCPSEALHLAEDDVSGAVHQIADDHCALVAVESERFSEPMADAAADDKSDAGASPDVADAGCSAMEHELAKQAEENLRRA